MPFMHTHLGGMLEAYFGGGSFYVSVSGIFCKRFTQPCHISVKTKNLGLVTAPDFTQFLDDKRIIWYYFYNLKQIKVRFYKNWFWFNGRLYFGRLNSMCPKCLHCLLNRIKIPPGAAS